MTEEAIKAEETKVDEKIETGVVDGTQKVVTDADPKVKAALAQSEQFSELLESPGFDSIEDLNESLSSGKTLQETLGGKDLDKLLKDSAELRRIEAHWADQKEKKQREDETPEETLERREKEWAKKEKEFEKKEDRKAETAEAQKALDRFNDLTTSLIGDDSDIPDTHKDVMKLLCGVGNMMNEIDISKKPEVKKMVKANKKILSAFAQAVIDAAVKKGEKIPPISETTSAAGDKPVKAKTIKEAGKMGQPAILRMLGITK